MKTNSHLTLICFGITLLGAVFSRAEVACWLTRIDAGDSKHIFQETKGLRPRYDEHQDDRYTLFQKSTLAPEKPSATGSVCSVTVDRARTYQTMLGYGAAMTDSSAWVLTRLKQKNPALYAFVMRRLFSAEEGAGFSLLRLPMGASDYVATSNYYTYCDAPSPDLSAFSIAHDREYVIPALREACAFNPSLRILATPWSAPAWMKTNGQLEGITAAQKKDGAANRLRPECVGLYAEYFVKFLEAYREAGLPVWGVTLQNEPQFDGARYPCMRMDEADQIALIRALGPKLVARKLETKIFAHDHNWILHPDDRKVLGGDAKMDPLASVTKIFSDPEAGRLVAGSAWHGYAGGASDMRRAYAGIAQAFPDKLILFTELSGWGKNRDKWFGDIAWGMERIWLGGAQSGCQSALQWNLVLDNHYGPTLRKDSAATAMAAVDTERWDSARFEREFYAMAQVSRAAQPGAKRVGLALGGSKADVDAVAFLQPSGKSALVVFNKGKEASSLLVSDGREPFAYALAARSIVTLIW